MSYTYNVNSRFMMTDVIDIKYIECNRLCAAYYQVLSERLKSLLITS
jgi:hypothetical protein